MSLFQVKSIIGPSLVSTPLKNHCFAFWLQEEDAEPEPWCCPNPHFYPDRQQDLEQASALLLQVMYLLPHQDQWHAPQMIQYTFPSTRRVLGGTTWKDDEHCGFYSILCRSLLPGVEPPRLTGSEPAWPTILEPKSQHTPPQPARGRHQSTPDAPYVTQNANHEGTAKRAWLAQMHFFHFLHFGEKKTQKANKKTHQNPNNKTQQQRKSVNKD